MSGELRAPAQKHVLQRLLESPVLGKTAYRERVKRVMGSVKARNVAMKTLESFRKTCRQVIKKKGGATRG